MKTTIELTNKDTKFIVNNLYPLYLHDLSEIWGWKPNIYGVFEDNETKTLIEQNKVFDIWWEHLNILFPYLIRVDGTPAGFALVATPPYAPPGCDFYLNEFFILRTYRGTGMAKAAAIQVFNTHVGRWELQTNPTDSNILAQTFWNKTMNHYTLGKYHKEIMDTKNDGPKLVIKFNNEK